MSADRSELHGLVDELPEDQVTMAADELRRRLKPQRKPAENSSSWIGMVKEARNGRTDNAQRVDQLLAGGFGRS